MTIRLGHLAFDYVQYDARGDVLYLAVGQPEEAADQLVTPEGHVLRFNEDGAIIGVTLINAQWLSQRDGGVCVSLPITADELQPAFA